MSSRRRFAGHARVKRSTDAKKVLEERGPLSLLSVASPPTGPIGPDTTKPGPLPPLPTATSGSGGGSNDGNGNGGPGNGGGSNSSGGPSGGPLVINGGTGSPGNGGGASNPGPTSILPQVEPTSETDANQSTSLTTSTSLPAGFANVVSSSSPVILSVNTAVTSLSSNGVPVATFSSGVAAATGSPGGGNNGTSNEDTGTISQSHNLSAGSIGGIVVALFIVGLATLVVMLRRRAIARRIKRRELWFAREALRTGNGASGGSVMRSQTSRSARSSFGTSFDQSHPDVFAAVMPPIPLMAEIRGEGPFVLNLDSSSLGSEYSRRNSAGSNRSTASDPNAQFVVLPPKAQDNEMMGTPMSVSPFSPTESYAFPRPPSDTNANRGSVSSCSQSNGFGEPEDNFQTSMAASPTLHLSGADANPFADPTPAETAMQSDFAEIQVIRRLFIPQLQDELLVAAGDSVRIVQMFDDGWAMVQKIPPLADKKGKARVVDESDQGLIPIDCLREADQTLPEFVAQLKRVSGYAGDLDVKP
jgi:hypothetical protein